MSDDEEIDVEADAPEAVGYSSDSARKLKVAQVLPLHTATGDHRKGTRGRPKSVKVDGQSVPKPTAAQLAYLARMQEAELQFVEEDPLVQAARGSADATEVIRLALIRVAQNAASLEFQRIELQKRGEDTSALIGRHTKVIKEISLLQAQLRELGSQTLDPRSEAFQRVFKLWIDRMKIVVLEVMTPEQADLFFTKFMTSMENWEEQAESVLR